MYKTCLIIVLVFLLVPASSKETKVKIYEDSNTVVIAKKSEANTISKDKVANHLKIRERLSKHNNVPRKKDKGCTYDSVTVINDSPKYFAYYSKQNILRFNNDALMSFINRISNARKQTREEMKYKMRPKGCLSPGVILIRQKLTVSPVTFLEKL